jgi:hypothetical protein
MKKRSLLLVAAVLLSCFASLPAGAGVCVNTGGGPNCVLPGPHTTVTAIPGCCVLVTSAGPVPLARTGVVETTEPGFDAVYRVYVNDSDTTHDRPLFTLWQSADVQRARFIYGGEELLVRNQVGCCVEVLASGPYLTLYRTGLFGDQYYLTLFVNGRKRVQCPWDSAGPHFDKCVIELP